MSAPQAAGWTRRRFLGGLTLTGTAGLLSLHAKPVAGEPPPETTTFTLAQTTSLCQAPQYIAEALLHGEGFTEVRYVKDARQDYVRALAAGEVDLTPAQRESRPPGPESGQPHRALTSAGTP